MQVFNRQIFESLISGTANVYTDTGFSELLASVDQMTFGVGVFGVTGTSPTITCQLENSCDGARWQNQNATPELNAQPLTAGQDNYTFHFINTANNPIPNFVRLRIALGGTSPVGVVRIQVNASSYSDP